MLWIKEAMFWGWVPVGVERTYGKGASILYLFRKIEP
jgi:hypothetical protein